MIVLGLGGAVGHDPAAALVIDGKIVAAAVEERFLRDKHAKGRQAKEATTAKKIRWRDGCPVDLMPCPPPRNCR